ncbi:hypothetical protein Thena_1550 [Thermodesulfobium narugense DSM 14796]|uniref:Uncharacterized protein n=1 Tax=Thermodesulfobium narugense DSM 14796 TaxID=747365 RepID=M1E5K9_9BACT|nr:hypothetical protein [Thermodesulfobium narugense]AEE15162.1 hypothetical protein Thena_1550 [Thermodesulfobium narugense DSM 14796]
MKKLAKKQCKIRWSNVVGIPKCFTIPETGSFSYKTKKGLKVEFIISLEDLEIHNVLAIGKNALKMV